MTKKAMPCFLAASTITVNSVFMRFICGVLLGYFRIATLNVPESGSIGDPVVL